MTFGPFDFSNLDAAAAKDTAGPTPFDWGKSFLWSAAESVPELIGITPSEETARWRAENPWSGIASEMAGMAVPYAGWWKASKLIKPLDSAAKTLAAGAMQRPFWANAASEAVRFAPFEVGRVGLSQFVGDKGLGEMTAEAGMNLALGAGLAGGIGVLAGAGKSVPALTELIPSLGADLPKQLMLRKIDEFLPTAPPEVAGQVRTIRENLDAQARGEIAPNSGYVAPLIGGSRDEVNWLFRSGQQGSVVKRRFVDGPTDDLTSFDTPDQWQAALGKAGVDPQSAAKDMQFPRYIQFLKGDAGEVGEDIIKAANDKATKWAEANPGADIDAVNDALQGFLREGRAERAGKVELRAQKAATKIEDSIGKNMKEVGDGWFLTRESEDGMFVMAKKTAGDIGKAAADDEWLVFKTDQPGRFATRAQQISNANIARERWIIGNDLVQENAATNELAREVAGLEGTFNFGRYADISQMAGPRGLAKAVDQVTPKALKGNVATQHVHGLFRTYLAPAAQQFGRSTRGRWVHGMGRMIQDRIDTELQTVLQGTARLGPKQNMWAPMVKPKFEGRSIDNALQILEREPQTLKEFNQLWRQGLSPEKAEELVAAGKLSSRTVEVARMLDTLDGHVMDALNAFQRMAGRTPLERRAGHYGVSREWEGDFFQAVRGEAGEIVGIASGHTARAAAAEAKVLRDKLATETGRRVRVGEAFTRSVQGQGLPRDLWPFVTNPGFMMKRENIRGFKWDTKDPTAKDWREMYKSNLAKRGRNMGSLAREAVLSRHIAALSVEDPRALAIVANRFNQMAGIEGEFTKMQNRIADRMLAPYIGSNSATKIVQATNKALFSLQLGFGKLAYPITNVVGTIQTIMPELAFVMNAAPETVNGTYHMAVPAVGTKGPVGVMGVLNPLKIYMQSMKEMARPDGDLLKGFERAANERVITPRMVEDYIGESADVGKKLRGMFKSPGDFGGAILELSEFMPRWSEEISRNMAFAAGWITARDVRGLRTPEELYHFAKQFTERTSYLYSTSDRPLAFTGPVGSSMGLFKNWMMNYMTGMMEYAGVGLRENTWSPLVWQTIGTFGVGGVAATPLYWLADGASRIMANKPIMQLAYDDMKGGNADAVMFGLPAALTGVSLSSSMTAPGANPVRDAAQLFSFAAWDRMKNAGGAVASAMDHWSATGQHPAADPDVRAYLVRAFAPVNLYRAMATQEEGVIRSLGTDLPQIKGLSAMDIWLYRAGLNPLEIDRQLKVANEVYASKEKRKNAVAAMGDAYAEAVRSGDRQVAEAVLRRALYTGVDMSAVLKSATTRMKQAEQDVVQRLGNPMDEVRWGNVLQPQY